MVNRRGVLFMTTLATVLMVSCDNNPTEPPTPVAITITVVDSDNISLPGATVTCITCQNQQVEVTDRQGIVTLIGWVPPITIRAEKQGYIATEQTVSDNDKILLGHEWPPETAASFRRLQLSPDALLNWNEDDVLGGGWLGGH